MSRKSSSNELGLVLNTEYEAKGGYQVEVTITPSPNNPGWAMWKDPDGIVWEIRYIVTQLPDEGPEYMEGRPFWNGTGSITEERAIEWDRFNEETLDPPLMKALDEFFHGPNVDVDLLDNGENGVTVLPSTASDIARIDNAIKILGEACETYDEEQGLEANSGNARSAWKFLEPVFGALADARGGLIYLSNMGYNNPLKEIADILEGEWNSTSFSEVAEVVKAWQAGMKVSP